MNRPITVSESRSRIPEAPDGSQAERIWVSNRPPERIKMHLVQRLRWVFLGIVIALGLCLLEQGCAERFIAKKWPIGQIVRFLTIMVRSGGTSTDSSPYLKIIAVLQ